MDIFCILKKCYICILKQLCMFQHLTYSFSSVSQGLAENYTFSAKERDSETGLSYFGSRYYSSDLSIWLSVDPMSDKYASLSPYNYCANNPVKLVDPKGEDIVITGKDGRETLYSPGMRCSGYDRFTKKTIRALNRLNSGKSNTGRSMLEDLVGSDNTFTIQKQNTKIKKESDFTPNNHFGVQICVDGYEGKLKEIGVEYDGDVGSGGLINWNSLSCRVKTSVGVRNNPFFGLVHELSHAWEANIGELDYTEVDGMSISEWHACANTNVVRKEFGKPLQTYYGGNTNQYGEFSGGIKIVNWGSIINY